MGMYTRLDLNVRFKLGTPADVIDELDRMVRGEGALRDGRWGWMLKSSSYYHDNINHASLIREELSGEWKLSVCCDLKNYESVIEEFCDWIAPHVETDAIAGYKRYEENAAPDLLWFVDGKAFWFTPTLPPELAELA